MGYEDLLKKAKKNMPEVRTRKRFAVPKPHVDTGKQTVIKNFSDIAKKLRRDPNRLAKYLYRELGAPGAIRNGELVLQGKFYFSVISERLENYVRTYVLCAECGRPDTRLEEGKIKMIKCEACGAKRPIG